MCHAKVLWMKPLGAKSLAIVCCLAALFSTTGCRWTSTGQNALGVSLYQQGRYSEALQQFQVALSSDPTNPDAYYNLASTYHKVGITQKDQQLIEQSESLYNQCLDLQPNHVDCHRGLAVLLAETSRPDSAVTLLKNWAAANPTMADPQIELSRIYQELGDTESAERHLDDALAINPSDFRAWNAKAQMRESAGDLTQALQNYQQSIAINSLQPDVYNRVAQLNVKIAQNTLTNGQPDSGWTVQNPNAAGSVKRY
jgi:Tfp pilus assembly protein PilF